MADTKKTSDDSSSTQTKKTTTTKRTTSATTAKTATTTDSKESVEKVSVAQDSWFKRHETDTGSPEFQINLMTQKITDLQGHLKGNHKDFDAKRALLKLVARRRNFLRYLKLNDIEKYLMVSKKTGLKV